MLAGPFSVSLFPLDSQLSERRFYVPTVAQPTPVTLDPNGIRYIDLQTGESDVLVDVGPHAVLEDFAVRGQFLYHVTSLHDSGELQVCVTDA